MSCSSMSTVFVLGPMVPMIEVYLYQLCSSFRAERNAELTFRKNFCSSVKSLKLVFKEDNQASWEVGLLLMIGFMLTIFFCDDELGNKSGEGGVE